MVGSQTLAHQELVKMIERVPLMKTLELRVDTTLGTDDLTPTSGHRITVHAYQASMVVPSALTSTVRATLCFGTAHVTDLTKVLASFRTIAKDTLGCVCLTNINVVGEVDEIVRLTNTTFSAGDCITRAVIYYSEKK